VINITSLPQNSFRKRKDSDPPFGQSATEQVRDDPTVIPIQQHNILQQQPGGSTFHHVNLNPQYNYPPSFYPPQQYNPYQQQGFFSPQYHHQYPPTPSQQLNNNNYNPYPSLGQNSWPPNSPYNNFEENRQLKQSKFTHPSSVTPSSGGVDERFVCPVDGCNYVLKSNIAKFCGKCQTNLKEYRENFNAKLLSTTTLYCEQCRCERPNNSDAVVCEECGTHFDGAILDESSDFTNVEEKKREMLENKELEEAIEISKNEH